MLSVVNSVLNWFGDIIYTIMHLEITFNNTTYTYGNIILFCLLFGIATRFVGMLLSKWLENKYSFNGIGKKD